MRIPELEASASLNKRKLTEEQLLGGGREKGTVIVVLQQRRSIIHNRTGSWSLKRWVKRRACRAQLKTKKSGPNSSDNKIGTELTSLQHSFYYPVTRTSLQFIFVGILRNLEELYIRKLKKIKTSGYISELNNHFPFKNAKYHPNLEVRSHDPSVFPSLC